ILPGELKAPSPEFKIVYGGPFPAATPCWSPHGSSFVVSLVNKDRNGDGLLTPVDGATLFRFDQVGGEYFMRPISLGDASESHPFWAENELLYFISNRRGNPDLWSVPAEGPVPPAPSASEGFSFALSIGKTAQLEERELTAQEFHAKLLAFDRLRRDFPQERAICARSMLESARLLKDAGDLKSTETFLKRIPRLYSDQKDVCAQAMIDYQLQVHQAAISPSGRFSSENPFSLIANLKDIQREFSNLEIVSARVNYLIGAALEQIGDVEGALNAYNTVVERYPTAGDYPALALLRIAEIYLTLGSDEAALSTYLEEINRFSDRSTPTNQAIRKVIELKVQGDEPIAGLQDLISRYGDLPALGAAAQKRIADLLAEAGEVELALGEYERLRGFAARHPLPYVRGMLAESLMSAAQLENRRGEYLKAQTRLEEVEEKFSDLQEGYYSRKARFMRIAMYSERAEYLSSIGDWELALATFERALGLDPESAHLHRGKIAAANALGKLGEVTRRYREQLAQNEEDAVLLYALGLCLSYSGEKSRAVLEASNSYIQRAIAKQPDLAYGYLTLGYNYELLENLIQRRAKTSGGIFSAGIRTIGKALDRLGKFLTFRGEEEPFRGYERAIEILQLGLAVNNEAVDPELEAQMLLNLGNNYYRLGEFGYPRALAAYLKRFEYDGSFASADQEAIIRERIGQAAAITGKNDLAIENYQQSKRLYHQSKRYEAELRILLRLAELYQVINAEEESNSYYRQALTLAQREGMEVSPAKWWENMAFNALNMGDDDEAATLSKKALAVLPPEEDIPVEKIQNPLILELLGIPIPIWNFGYLGTGSPMSARGLTKRDELLLNYSILQEVHNRRKDVVSARDEAFKRLAIAVQRKDAEAEAILWSEIGFLDWSEGDFKPARRDFIRSLKLCGDNGMKSGYLSALINLSCLILSDSSGSQSPKNILFKETKRFSDFNIGLNAEKWEEIRRTIEEVDPGLDAPGINKRLRRSLQPNIDPLSQIPDIIDW
ncbi:MAG TPA: tetratricopeptide repeat protein, partial [Bacteroidetes bacterium]|nr:tetratricopeptide repeat protein [Bacteroidota bacterium]